MDIVRIEIALHLILVVNGDGLTQSGDTDLDHTVAYEAHETDRLRGLPVDPLFVVLVGGARKEFAHLGLGCARGGDYHLAVHTDEYIVLSYSVLEKRRQSVRVGLAAGLDAEVDDGVEQRLHLGRADVGDAALKDQRDTAARYLGPVVGNKGGVINLHVAQEAMLEIRATVEVEDDAVGLDRDRSDGDPIARLGRLTFLVEHLLVGVATGRQIAVCHQDEAVAERQRAVGKALFRLKVTHQFKASSLGNWGRWQLNPGGAEFGGDVGHCGLFSDHKHLRIALARLAYQRASQETHREGCGKLSKMGATKGHGQDPVYRKSCTLSCLFTSGNPKSSFRS